MSKDDAVCIIAFIRIINGKPTIVYVVRWIQGAFWDMDHAYFLEIVKDAKYTTSLTKAKAIAQKIIDLHGGYVEYGIRMVEEFKKTVVDGPPPTNGDYFVKGQAECFSSYLQEEHADPVCEKEILIEQLRDEMQTLRDTVRFLRANVHKLTVKNSELEKIVTAVKGAVSGL